MDDNEIKNLEQQYKDLLSSYRKMTWISVGSLLALTTTVIYSKYQIYRKKKIIDQKDNQIQNQKEELFHIRAHAKQINKELADEYTVILKNLRKSILHDTSIQSIKDQINKPLQEINHALSSKIQVLKNYNYKKQMEKWYLSHVMGNALQFPRLRKIEIVEASWNNQSGEVQEQGYSWSKGKQAKTSDDYQNEYGKMKQYLEKKNSYDAKGVEISASSHYLGNTFGNRNKLRIKYKCWGFDVKSGEFTIPLSSGSKKEQETTIGEGQQKIIECDDSWVSNS